MWRTARTVLAIIVLGVALYAYRSELTVVAYQTYRRIEPCAVPIRYSIRSIDPRFGISTSTLEKTLARAEAPWEEASGKQLFTYDPADATLQVDLVYDDRQERTTRLKELGIAIDSGLSTYETVHARYVSAKAAFDTQQAAYERDRKALEARITTYEDTVRSWNERGGAPRSVYESLDRERIAIDRESDSLNARADRLNSAVQDVNALAAAANKLARSLNTTAATYADNADDAEFEEAVYESAPGAESITVYEFDSADRLARVLAHEFGHALGLDHVEGRASIMFRLNAGEGMELTPEDTAALTKTCHS